jgi:hypothetical protein
MVSSPSLATFLTAIFGYVPDRHLSFRGAQTSTSTPAYASIMNLTLVRSSVSGPDSTFAQAVSAPKPIVKPSDLLLPAVSTVKSTLKQSDVPSAATSGAANRTSSASSKLTDAPQAAPVDKVASEVTDENLREPIADSKETPPPTNVRPITLSQWRKLEVALIAKGA